MVPVISRLTPQGYDITVLPRWADYPSDDPVADTARSVVMLQQMAGVLYVAILISRMTQMQALRRRGGGD